MYTQSLVQVLVVEDSITVRRFLVELINKTPGLMVCGEAYDGLEAVRLTSELSPDVVSMDVQMPRMDGVEATRQIMAQHPTPIVIASSGVGQGEVDVTMQALAAGAVAAIPKPDAAPSRDDLRMDYVRMLRYMSKVSVVRRRVVDEEPEEIPVDNGAQPKLVVMGASAGGPGAFARILNTLPADFPVPIVIVQHLSAEFVPGFVDWLDRNIELTVRLAEPGVSPLAGEVWVAPGDYHTSIQPDGSIALYAEQGEFRFQPAVDMLFQSAVATYGNQLVGVLLTGMGDDGAQGLRTMRDAMAYTIVQDEDTSVVFGMPAAALQLDAVSAVLPDIHIAQALIDLCMG